MRLIGPVLMLLLMSLPAGARPAVDAYDGRPPTREVADRRCTDDGYSCIYLETYVEDVCRTIERAATREGLDKNFFARLLWKESMFEPAAVSPVGAEGIAQFMPSTAAIVGLADPFNPAKAIHASAAYLRRLELFYGTLGIAAVAYNGGEGRADQFMRDGGQLPYETQDYVEAITGHNAWKWRDNPPEKSSLKLQLDGEKPFLPACIHLAGNRSLKEFSTSAKRNPVLPWGVILAAHPTRNGVQGQINRLNRQLRPLLGGKRVSYVRRSMTGNPRKVYTAQVGWSSRTEATMFCQKVRTIGASCIVLKN